jgi:uncharacterized protein YbaP (TraB family)
MKLLQLCLLMVTLFTNLFNGFSQDTTSTERTSSLLWEITGKKVKSPSYIFGTMHLIPKDQFLFPESLQDKVKNAELLVMEIGGLSEQMKGMQLMMLCDVQSSIFISPIEIEPLLMLCDFIIRLISVDFPDPDKPTKPIFSDLLISKFKSLKTKRSL